MLRTCEYMCENGNKCSAPITDTDYFCNNHKLTKEDMEIYKATNEHYRQDLREFWARSNMYILAQAFLFAGFATIASQSVKDASLHVHDFWFEAAIAAVGAFLGLFGFFVACGSNAWVERWRNQMLKLDNAINRHHSYYQVERYKQKGAPAPEPSKGKQFLLWCPGYLTQLLPLVFFFGWLSIFLIALFLQLRA